MMEEDLKELKKRAQSGDMQAQFDLAMEYYRDRAGRYGEDGEAKAIKWFEKAAEQGHVDAQYWYGHCLKCGVGIRFSNDDYAAVWFEKAAEQGHVGAQKEMYSMYTDGLTCTKWDYEKALYWLKKAVEAGDKQAEFELGQFYDRGTFVEDSKGVEIEPNLEEAFKWYLSSAEKGYFLAMDKVGDFYHDGRGVEKDFEKAAYWYEKTVEARGYRTWVKLGNMYFYGEFFERDYKKAFECFNSCGWSALAKKRMGDCYVNGLGVEKDFEKARECYIWAADHDDYGFDNVRLEVARIFAQEGPLHDEITATKLYGREAWSNSKTEAYYEYGIRCLGHDGLTEEERMAKYGIKQDEWKGALYFKLASEKNHVRATYMYGVCLLNGYGTDKDEQAAKEKFEKAAELGSEEAKEALKKYFN